MYLQPIKGIIAFYDNQDIVTRLNIYEYILDIAKCLLKDK